MMRKRGGASRFRPGSVSLSWPGSSGHWDRFVVNRRRHDRNGIRTACRVGLATTIVRTGQHDERHHRERHRQDH